MKKIITIIFMNLFFLTAQAQNIEPRVSVEIMKFKGLSSEYAQRLSTFIHSKLLKNAEQYANKKSKCVPHVKVKFIDNLTSPSVAAEKEFESGFLAIEATLCFENTSSEKVVALFYDRDFKRNAISTIVHSYTNGQAICEKTFVMTIGSSHYCYIQSFLPNPEYLMGYNFNIWNDTIDKADSPIYFRETMYTAVQKSNITDFRFETYVRGPQLSFLQKKFASGAIQTEQQKVYEKMQLNLGK